MKKRKEFVITRLFHASRALVWKAWTNPENLKHWWGPKGLQIKVSKFDLRPGGTFHYSMQNEEGPGMWGKFVFREIDAPGRLVFVNSFVDEEGYIIRPPFEQIWPKEILHKLILTEQNSKTLLTLHTIPINATEEEYKTFGENFDSMNQGFAGTLDKLEAYLAQVRSTINPDEKFL